MSIPASRTWSAARSSGRATPNRAARALVTRRTGAVALIVSGAGDAFAGRVFADPFFGRVVNGVVGHLRARMTQPVLLFAESAAARTQVVDYLRQGSADGALVVSVQPDDPLPDMLLSARVPTVLFARPTRATPVSCVDLDHRAGGRLAGEHLLGRGCRRIAVIGAPPDLRAGRERLAGFRDALARAGHDSPPVAEGVFTLDSGAVAMAALLGPPAVDGVFAANDLMAQGACQVVRELGRRIPGDVAVVGFDDSSISSDVQATADHRAPAGGGDGGGHGQDAGRAGPGHPHRTPHPRLRTGTGRTRVRLTRRRGRAPAIGLVRRDQARDSRWARMISAYRRPLVLTVRTCVA